MRDDLVLLGRTLATSMQSPSGFGMEMIESELKRDAKNEERDSRRVQRLRTQLTVTFPEIMKRIHWLNETVIVVRVQFRT